MCNKQKTVIILGTEYAIDYLQEKDDEKLKRLDGYIDNTVKKIVIANVEKQWDSVEYLEDYKKQLLRHEIIHAFLDESGLRSNSEWARNEEMVDFFAIQFHKIANAFKECDC